MSSLQEVILEADLRCAECQERIANAISRVADVESVEVHMSKKKKKVILTRKSVNVSEESSRKNAAVALYDRKPRKISRITTAWFPSYA
ncbi:Heavy metal-associated domain containing protein [Melia azedarach]|uniref:Heavy metal-associated domain containing protein n=1 Tax=Melia azedarach TaxID=155640 RepID=A0ACC1XR41_MELAZ|nr:Heavy metal-associated domain containing protein [Melia azedarach]